MTRRALRYASTEVIDKVWALRFMLSQAHLVVGRDVFRLADEGIHAALRRRWDDLPGTLVACEGERPLPGAVQQWVRFDTDGRFTAGQDQEGEGDEPMNRPPRDMEREDG